MLSSTSQKSNLLSICWFPAFLWISCCSLCRGQRLDLRGLVVQAFGTSRRQTGVHLVVESRNLCPLDECWYKPWATKFVLAATLPVRPTLSRWVCRADFVRTITCNSNPLQCRQSILHPALGPCYCPAHLGNHAHCTCRLSTRWRAMKCTLLPCRSCTRERDASSVDAQHAPSLSHALTWPSTPTCGHQMSSAASPRGIARARDKREPVCTWQWVVDSSVCQPAQILVCGPGNWWM